MRIPAAGIIAPDVRERPDVRLVTVTRARVADVSLTERTIGVAYPRIAFDCGAVVNPDRVRAQLEGAVVQGISLATLGEISFKAGRVEQTNFDSYEVTRIDAAPGEIRTHLLTSTGYDKPLGGVGEPGLPPVAPALTNAIFSACGKRIRALPIWDQLAQRM